MTEIKEMKNHFLQSDNLTGLWIDALAVDQDTQLLFLSAWGSETVVQNCRARFSLPVSEGGLRRFRLDDGPSRWTSVQVRVDEPERYEQLTGRPSGQSRFLHLTHLWMFPRLALQSDSANCTALLFNQRGRNAGSVGNSAVANGTNRLSRALASFLAQCHDLV